MSNATVEEHRDDTRRLNDDLTLPVSPFERLTQTISATLNQTSQSVVKSIEFPKEQPIQGAMCLTSFVRPIYTDGSTGTEMVLKRANSEYVDITQAIENEARTLKILSLIKNFVPEDIREKFAVAELVVEPQIYEDTIFFIQSKVGNINLKTAISENLLSQVEITEVLDQLSQIFQTFDEFGIYLQDLKIENIVLDVIDGELKVNLIDLAPSVFDFSKMVSKIGALTSQEIEDKVKDLLLDIPNIHNHNFVRGFSPTVPYLPFEYFVADVIGHIEGNIFDKDHNSEEAMKHIRSRNYNLAAFTALRILGLKNTPYTYQPSIEPILEFVRDHSNAFNLFRKDQIKQLIPLDDAIFERVYSWLEKAIGPNPEQHFTSIETMFEELRVAIEK